MTWLLRLPAASSAHVSRLQPPASLSAHLRASRSVNPPQRRSPLFLRAQDHTCSLRGKATTKTHARIHAWPGEFPLARGGARLQPHVRAPVRQGRSIVTATVESQGVRAGLSSGAALLPLEPPLPCSLHAPIPLLPSAPRCTHPRVCTALQAVSYTHLTLPTILLV